MSSLSPAEKDSSPNVAPKKTGNFNSLSSPQLLAELVQSQARWSPQGSSPELCSPLASPPASPTFPPTSPRSPPVTPPQPLSPTQESLALSSPELLSELKQYRPLRHVNPQRGLTTVFSGRGRVARGSAAVSQSTGHSQPHPSPGTLTDERRENVGGPLVVNGTQR